jgi:hypothetical protein
MEALHAALGLRGMHLPLQVNEWELKPSTEGLDLLFIRTD